MCSPFARDAEPASALTVSGSVGDPSVVIARMHDPKAAAAWQWEIIGDYAGIGSRIDILGHCWAAAADRLGFTYAPERSRVDAGRNYAVSEGERVPRNGLATDLAVRTAWSGLVGWSTSRYLENDRSCAGRTENILRSKHNGKSGWTTVSRQVDQFRPKWGFATEVRGPTDHTFRSYQFHGNVSPAAPEQISDADGWPQTT